MLGRIGRSPGVATSQLVAGTIKTATEVVIAQNVYTQMAALCTPHSPLGSPSKEISCIVIESSGRKAGGRRQAAG